MIPSTQWYCNVRSSIKDTDWDRLRRFIYERAKWRCEACGRKCSPGELDAHEIWDFVHSGKEPHIKRTQKLIRIAGLCKMCHGVFHFQLSTERGIQEEITKHMLKIRKWTLQEFEEHKKKQET